MSTHMTEHFLKFKRKLQTARILKTVLLATALGFLVGGIMLILSKLGWIPLSPVLSLPIALGAFLTCGIVTYCILNTTDEQLAKDLDTRFGLQEKVQTMISYRKQVGGMIELQRQDADLALARIPVSQFKLKRLWAYILATCIGATTLVSAFFVKAKENVEPVIPFQISAIQIAGINELIENVDNSDLDEPYKTNISTKLTDLLAELQTATTTPQMQTALRQSLTYIQTQTHNSSSSAEILTALWNTQDPFLKAFAKALDTSDWTENDWGGYVEKMAEFERLFQVQDDANQPPKTDEEKRQTLTWNLQNSSIKIETALSVSKIAPTDCLYTAVYDFVRKDEGEQSGEHVFGIGVIPLLSSVTTYDSAIAELRNTFDKTINGLYERICQLKANANVGEHVLKKLSALFSMEVPAFERPTFAQSDRTQTGTNDNDDQDGNTDGGIGEGAVYGSDDLVLDPLTGEYVEYGTLLDKYYAVMYEKLENGNYTEEQKNIIKNYFALLYSGITP